MPPTPSTNPSKILITGSAEGLGSLAAQALSARGHAVYLHARNAQRAADARRACPSCAGVLTGDLSSPEETRKLAEEARKMSPWHAVVHNAGVMRADPGEIFRVNSLAAWTLTVGMMMMMAEGRQQEPPPVSRFVFLSSDSHYGGSTRGLSSGRLEETGGCSYGDSKLHNVMLANWFSRHFREKRGWDVPCHSMDPGWVATKMGGRMAPGSPEKAVDTYVMLAEGSGDAEKSSGKYWLSSREDTPRSEATDEGLQEQLAEVLARVSGVRPEGW